MRRGNSHDSWHSRIRYRIQGKSWEWVSKAVLSMPNLVDRLLGEVETCEMASVSLESAMDWQIDENEVVEGEVMDAILDFGL